MALAQLVVGTKAGSLIELALSELEKQEMETLK